MMVTLATTIARRISQMTRPRAIISVIILIALFVAAVLYMIHVVRNLKEMFWRKSSSEQKSTAMKQDKDDTMTEADVTQSEGNDQTEANKGETHLTQNEQDYKVDSSEQGVKKNKEEEIEEEQEQEEGEGEGDGDEGDGDEGEGDEGESEGEGDEAEAEEGEEEKTNEKQISEEKK